jgi:phosphohistidine phosphatase SixA
MLFPIRRPAAAAAPATALLAAALLAPTALGEGPERQALKPRLQGQALVDALRQGGFTILMRHTATEAVAPDPESFDIDDCKTQRNLSEQGRREAEAIGAALRKLGIRVSKVVSSPFCRCLDTGRLAFGQSEASDVLSVGDELTFEEKHERGRVVRQMLATPPEPGTNSVLITHTGTLLYSFGLDSRPEGIAHVFQPGPAGTSVYVGSLLPDDWPRLAGLAAAGPGAPPTPPKGGP